MVDPLTVDQAPRKDAFFVQVDDDRFAATEITRGPWDENSQHAGPPAALLGWAIEHRAGADGAVARGDMRVARITFDILKPVPIATLHVTTRVVHSGRSIEVVEATLAALATDGAPGPVLMRANAVRIRVAADLAPAHASPPTIADPQTIPETPTRFRFDVGYHTAMETRYAVGSFHEPGPASVWFRMRHPLIDGAPIDPLSRVLTAADSGNGVSQVLSLGKFMFVNPDLTVHLHRYPVGEWVCLDSVTSIDPAGIGLADTALHDESGQIGRGTQSLFVAALA